MFNYKKMDKFDFLTIRLEQLQKAGLLRKMVCIDSAQNTLVTIAGKEKLIFCSNNYLGLANHPRIIQAVIDAVSKFGHGAAASRLISGTMTPHTDLEQTFAKLFQKESALIFPSGWMANEAVIKTIPQKNDLLLLDKLDHASIIDAAKAAHANFRTYRRGSYEKLEKLLASKDYKRKFIVTESIFSMDGDTADLQTLVNLKNKYNAFLIVDEAHSLGCRGTRGAGLADELGLLDHIDIIVATMSKALGSAGGVVAANKIVTDILINQARAFIYTTSPTIANCAAASAAIDIITNEPQRRQRLRKNADYLRQKLNLLGIDTAKSQSHIIPIIIGKQTQTLTVSQRLYEMGFFVVAIRPPTVAPGTSRLRLSIQSEHTKQQIDKLCDALNNLVIEGLIPAVRK